VGRYLLLTGEMLTGTEAVACGLATITAEPDALDAAVDRIVGRLRHLGWGTLQTVKGMIVDHLEADRHAELSRELERFVAHVESAPDARIGLDAFQAGREPSFAYGDTSP
jgi:enoyl-CoA hydratase/carnithine racemase